jgi:sarcosine oxidase subunit beta
MVTTAEAVVIGGGVNGSSIALHLVRRGVRNVVLVEKGHIASGPTGRSSGIVRQHYTLEPLARMAHDSLHVFERFADETGGGDAGFVQCGAVFAGSEAMESAVRSTVEMHRRIGIRESMLTADEIRKMEPNLSMENIAFATWEPDDGYADPSLTANSFAEAAAREGVKVQLRTRVTAIRTDERGVSTVVTDKGEIATRAVVNACGPWAREVAAMVGADLPIFATRHPVLILQRPPSWRTVMPVWIDLVEGWYYKPERNTAIMVGSLQNFAEGETADIEGYSTVPDYTEVERYSEATVKRFPIMEQGLAQGGWAGIYDMTPDGQPVLDAVPEVPGFFCAAGFSGHGFKLSPAIGKVMAEVVTDGKAASYDLSLFRYSRFRENRLTRTAYEFSIVG